MNLLVAGVIGITAFVIVQLLQKEVGNKRSMRIALLMQLVWLFRLLLLYIKLDLEQEPNAFAIVYDQTLVLLDGPLFWLYTRSLIETQPFKKRILWHFLPFALLFINSTNLAINSPEVVTAKYDAVVTRIISGEQFADRFDAIFIVIVLGVSLIYVLRAVRIGRAYNQRLLENYSAVENMMASWIVSFQRIWVLMFLLPIFIYFTNYIYPITQSVYILIGVLLALCVFSVFFSSSLLRQVYAPASILQKSLQTTGKPIDIDQRQIEKIKREMGEQQYYLDEELSLRQLADFLELKPAELTELIKASEYENFYDFVNSYRIDKVKQQLKQSDEQIIQLAYQNGFKSKSTFNKIFKEKTGFTPKAYRLSIK